MATDKLANTFVVKTRDVVRDDYFRDFRSRQPLADATKDSQLFVEASSFADGLAPLYYDVSQCADGTSRRTSAGTMLDEDGADLGLERAGPGKSNGNVILVVASGGATINAGTELKLTSTGQQFISLVDGTYNNGDLLACQSVDTGTDVNVPAGTTLTFTTPPAGVSEAAIVFQNTDGSGFNGGAPAELDDDYRARQDEIIANPPAAGNSAQVIRVVESIPGLPIEKCFCYPAILGPGTMGVCFTVRPAFPGGSRIPNAVQIALVAAALEAAFPEDDGIIVADGLDDLVQVNVLASWLPGVTSWTDAIQWPIYYSSDPVHVTAGGVSSATVHSSAVIADPVPGQTIGFYDTVTRTFRRKRILSVVTVSATHTYTLTFDMTSLGASDLTFAPATGAVVSPWSDSLTSLVAPILSYVDGQGPGEQVASFADPGLRQKRIPIQMPSAWPSVIGNRLVDGLFGFVLDAELAAPTPPHATTVGTPGVLFYLHRVSGIGAFPE